MIQQVGAGDTHALRHRVLRPHQTLAEMVYPDDDDPATGHFVARADDGTIIGIVTVAPRPPAGGPDGWWRLRGMATAEEYRSQGVGAALVAAALAHTATHGGTAVWCHARLPAVAFYRRAGFVTTGEPWDEPGIGPHIVMWRAIPPLNPGAA